MAEERFEDSGLNLDEIVDTSIPDSNKTEDSTLPDSNDAEDPTLLNANNLSDDDNLGMSEDDSLELDTTQLDENSIDINEQTPKKRLEDIVKQKTNPKSNADYDLDKDKLKDLYDKMQFKEKGIDFESFVSDVKSDYAFRIAFFKHTGLRGQINFDEFERYLKIPAIISNMQREDYLNAVNTENQYRQVYARLHQMSYDETFDVDDDRLKKVVDYYISQQDSFEMPEPNIDVETWHVRELNDEATENYKYGELSSAIINFTNADIETGDIIPFDFTTINMPFQFGSPDPPINLPRGGKFERIEIGDLNKELYNKNREERDIDIDGLIGEKTVEPRESTDTALSSGKSNYLFSDIPADLREALRNPHTSKDLLDKILEEYPTAVDYYIVHNEDYKKHGLEQETIINRQAEAWQFLTSHNSNPIDAIIERYGTQEEFEQRVPGGPITRARFVKKKLGEMAYLVSAIGNDFREMLESDYDDAGKVLDKFVLLFFLSNPNESEEQKIERENQLFDLVSENQDLFNDKRSTAWLHASLKAMEISNPDNMLDIRFPGYKDYEKEVLERQKEVDKYKSGTTWWQRQWRGLTIPFRSGEKRTGKYKDDPLVHYNYRPDNTIMTPFRRSIASGIGGIGTLVKSLYPNSKIADALVEYSEITQDMYPEYTAYQGNAVLKYKWVDIDGIKYRVSGDGKERQIYSEDGVAVDPDDELMGKIDKKYSTVEDEHWWIRWGAASSQTRAVGSDLVTVLMGGTGAISSLLRLAGMGGKLARGLGLFMSSSILQNKEVYQSVAESPDLTRSDVAINSFLITSAISLVETLGNPLEQKLLTQSVKKNLINKYQKEIIAGSVSSREARLGTFSSRQLGRDALVKGYKSIRGGDKEWNAFKIATKDLLINLSRKSSRGSVHMGKNIVGETWEEITQDFTEHYGFKLADLETFSVLGKLDYDDLDAPALAETALITILFSAGVSSSSHRSPTYSEIWYDSALILSENPQVIDEFLEGMRDALETIPNIEDRMYQEKLIESFENRWGTIRGRIAALGDTLPENKIKILRTLDAQADILSVADSADSEAIFKQRKHQADKMNEDIAEIFRQDELQQENKEDIDSSMEKYNSLVKEMNEAISDDNMDLALSLADEIDDLAVQINTLRGIDEIDLIKPVLDESGFLSSLKDHGVDVDVFRSDLREIREEKEKSLNEAEGKFNLEKTRELSELDDQLQNAIEEGNSSEVERIQAEIQRIEKENQSESLKELSDSFDSKYNERVREEIEKHNELASKENVFPIDYDNIVSSQYLDDISGDKASLGGKSYDVKKVIRDKNGNITHLNVEDKDGNEFQWRNRRRNSKDFEYRGMTYIRNGQKLSEDEIKEYNAFSHEKQFIFEVEKLLGNQREQTKPKSTKESIGVEQQPETDVSPEMEERDGKGKADHEGVSGEVVISEETVDRGKRKGQKIGVYAKYTEEEVEGDVIKVTSYRQTVGDTQVSLGDHGKEIAALREGSKEQETSSDTPITSLDGQTVFYGDEAGTVKVHPGGRVEVTTQKHVYEHTRDTDLANTGIWGLDIEIIDENSVKIDGQTYNIKTDENGNIIEVSNKKQKITDDAFLVKIEVERNKSLDNPEVEKLISESNENESDAQQSIVLNVLGPEFSPIDIAWNENMNETVDKAIQKLYDGLELTENEHLAIELWANDAIERIGKLHENHPNLKEKIDDAINAIDIIDNLNRRTKDAKEIQSKREVVHERTVQTRKPRTEETDSRGDAQVQPTTELPADRAKPEPRTDQRQDDGRRIGGEEAQVGRENISDIVRLPSVFQYKATTEKSGINEDERIPDEAEFNRNMAGTLMVWRDTDNQLGYGKDKVFLVDGHHRMEFMERKGVTWANVLYLNAETPREAMIEAAKTNIAQNRGTSFDAAKIFREASDAEIEGFASTSRKAVEGRALAQLHPRLFQMAQNGEIRMGDALALSKLIEDQQLSGYDFIKEQLQKGKLTVAEVNEFVDMVNAEVIPTIKQRRGEDSGVQSMFGSDENERILFLERARLAAYIQGRLAKDKRVAAAAKRYEGRMKDLDLGKIDKERANELVKEGNTILGLYESLKNVAPISGILANGAKDLEAAKRKSDKEKVQREYFEKVREALEVEAEAMFGKKKDSTTPAQTMSKEDAQKELENTKKEFEEKNKGLDDKLAELQAKMEVMSGNVSEETKKKAEKTDKPKGRKPKTASKKPEKTDAQKELDRLKKEQAAQSKKLDDQLAKAMEMLENLKKQNDDGKLSSIAFVDERVTSGNRLFDDAVRDLINQVRTNESQQNIPINSLKDATFQDIAKVMSNVFGNVTYTKVMSQADKILSPEEKSRLVDNYINSYQEVAEDKVFEAQDILEEEGLEAGKKYKLSDMLKLFPPKSQAKIMNDIIKSGIDAANVEITFNPELAGLNTWGVIDRTSGDISINPEAIKEGNIGEVLIHEAIHGVTQGVIASYFTLGENHVTAQQAKGVEALNELYNNLKDVVDPEFAYQMSSIHEFVAGLSNKEFADYLQQDHRSTWQKIWDAIASIFGIKRGTNYDKAVNALKDIISDNTRYERSGFGGIGSGLLNAQKESNAEQIRELEEQIKALIEMKRQLTEDYGKRIEELEKIISGEEISTELEKTTSQEDGKETTTEETESTGLRDRPEQRPDTTDDGDQGRPGQTQEVDAQEEVDLTSGTQRPPLVVLGNPPKVPNKMSRQYEVDSNQALGINAILQRFEDGGKGFLLADGAGVGKTRQMLVVAEEFRLKNERPILIVTQNQTIIDNNFTDDANALGIDLSNFEVKTYHDISANKLEHSEYGLIIFDESHNLKNDTSDKTKISKTLKKDHILFATATPTDKHNGVGYFTEITGMEEEEVLDKMGLQRVMRQFKNKSGVVKEYQAVILKKGFDPDMVNRAIIEFHEKIVSDGAMLRREYPFFGSIIEDNIPMRSDEIIEQNEIMKYWEEAIARAPEGKALSMYAQRSMDLSKWNELSKIPYVLHLVEQEIKEGRQVVILGEFVNDIKITALDEEVVGFGKQIADILEEKGYTVARVFGGYHKAREVKKFQDGKAQIVVGTARSASTGINLDDAVGDSPRTLIVATPNYGGDVFQQSLGRVSRRNTRSQAKAIVLYKQGFSDTRRREIVTGKIAVLQALQMGKIEDNLDLGGVLMPEEAALENIDVFNLGEDTFGLFGDTYAISDKLKELGGVWDNKVRHPKTNDISGAWIFPNESRARVLAELTPVLNTSQVQRLSKYGIGDSMLSPVQVEVVEKDGKFIVVDKNTNEQILDDEFDSEIEALNEYNETYREYGRKYLDREKARVKVQLIDNFGANNSLADELIGLMSSMAIGQVISGLIISEMEFFANLSITGEALPINIREEAIKKGIELSNQLFGNEEVDLDSSNYQDVGEKIGGAKKDIAQANLLSDEEIGSKPFNQTFPKPDYAAIVRDGVLSFEIASFLDYLYESANTRRPTKKRDKRKWIDDAKNTIELTNAIFDILGQDPGIIKEITDEFKKSVNAIELEVHEEVLRKLGFPNTEIDMHGYRISASRFIGRVVLAKGNNIIDTFHNVDDAIKRLKNEIEAETHRKTTRGNLPNKVTVFTYRGGEHRGKAFIGYKHSGKYINIMGELFNSSKEAHTFLKENADIVKDHYDRLLDIRKLRRAENSSRIGKDWRKGKDVTSQQFRDSFGFRGVEFGNWVDTKERASNINQAYDALMDLAFILGIDPKSISLNGRLALAFGARGSGKAAAHYERGVDVINLTKTRGEGSLAHEWMHAVDNYLANKEKPGLTMLTEGKASLTDALLINQLKEFNALVRTHTDLKDRSERADSIRGGKYYGTNHEIIARAFEGYVANELQKHKFQNDYLVNYRNLDQMIALTGNNEEMHASYPYPLSSEMDAVGNFFDSFFDAIKGEDGRLYSADVASFHIDSGKRIISALKALTSQEGTAAFVHELSHDHLTTTIDAALKGNAVAINDIKTIITEYENQTGRKISENRVMQGHIDFVNGRVNKDFRSFQEFFADAAESYFMKGEFSVPKGIRGILNKIADAIRNIYNNLLEGKIPMSLSKEMTNVFDRMLGGKPIKKTDSGNIFKEPSSMDKPAYEPEVTNTDKTLSDGRKEELSATRETVFSDSKSEEKQNSHAIAPSEFQHYSPRWGENNNFNFDGTNSIQDASDVAYIMRELENRNNSHYFAVHVDENGVPHIQYLAMNPGLHFIFDRTQIFNGIKRFNTKELYLVANTKNPNSDINKIKVEQLLSGLELTTDIPTKMMFVGDKSGKYLLFDDVNGMTAGDRVTPNISSKMKVEQVDGFTIQDPYRIEGVLKGSDVAFFIKQLGLSALPKMGILLMDNQSNVIGNYFLNPDNISGQIIDIISKTTNVSGVIYYHNSDLPPINNTMSTLGRMGVKTLDIVKLNSNNEDIESNYTKGLVNVYNRYRTNGMATPVVNRVSGKRGNKTSLTLSDGSIEEVEYKISGNIPQTVSNANHNYKAYDVAWRENKSIDLTGSVQINSDADVAHIMRSLEDKNIEHLFAVYVDKNGEGHVQLLGMGDKSSISIDYAAVLSGIKTFNAEKLYFVHNHPSGNLHPSNEDIRMTNILNSIISSSGSKVGVEHVIMDTYKNQYTHFKAGTTLFDVKIKDRDLSRTDTSKIPVYSFDSVKALTSTDAIAYESVEGAIEFIYKNRFSVLPKNGVLLLNADNAIVGDFVIEGEVTPDKIADMIAINPGVKGLFFYGNIYNIGSASINFFKNTGISVKKLRLPSNNSHVEQAYIENDIINIHEPLGIAYGTTSLNETRGLLVARDPSYEGEKKYSYATESIKAIIQNPNDIRPKVVIELLKEDPSIFDRAAIYSQVYIDVLGLRNTKLYEKGLELIRNTSYADKAPDLETALKNALEDRLLGTRRKGNIAALTEWASKVWGRIGDRLGITRVNEMNIDSLLDAMTSHIYSRNEIFNLANKIEEETSISDEKYLDVKSEVEELVESVEEVASKEEVVEIEETPIVEVEEVVEVEETPIQALSEQDQLIIDEIDEALNKKEAHKTDDEILNDIIGLANKFNNPDISESRIRVADMESLNDRFDNRDSSATGTIASENNMVGLKDRNKSSATKSKVIESFEKLSPTLRNMGIKLFFHESYDSFANAIINNGGTESTTHSAQGVYIEGTKEIHINLSNARLKTNVAVHEAIHPLLVDLIMQNPKLYNSLVEQLLSDPTLRRKYYEEFGYAYRNDGDTVTRNEALTEFLADTVVENLFRITDEKVDNSLLKKIIDFIKEFFGDLAVAITNKQDLNKFANKMADAIASGKTVTISKGNLKVLNEVDTNQKVFDRTSLRNALNNPSAEVIQKLENAGIMKKIC